MDIREKSRITPYRNESSVSDDTTTWTYDEASNGIAAHYDYAPFGVITRTASDTRVIRDIVAENPFRFSSEVHDDSLALVYYNYRHYNPISCKWLSRDPSQELGGVNLYNAFENRMAVDYLGLSVMDGVEEFFNDAKKIADAVGEFTKEQIVAAGKFIASKYHSTEDRAKAAYAYGEMVVKWTLDKMAKIGDPCGSGPTAIFIPNGLLAFMLDANGDWTEFNIMAGIIWVNFSHCCSKHDTCYENSCKTAKKCKGDRNQLKQKCDQELGDCIRETYDKQTGLLGVQGDIIGGIYQKAVEAKGDTAFDDACKGEVR